jgi:hypothetical protein
MIFGISTIIFNAPAPVPKEIHESYGIIIKVYPRSFQNCSCFIPGINGGPRGNPEIALPPSKKWPKCPKISKQKLYFNLE